jgi:3-oxoacyl-[acyl-carrier-protein] synthase-3
MGAIIEAVRTVQPRRFGRPGAIDLAARAARKALKAAGCHPSDVDVVINTGIYRVENIYEPALAPFVQEKIGANIPFSPDAKRGIWSFDLANGSCGFLNALQVVDGLVSSGKLRRGLVVTSDVEPFPGVTEGWEFDPVGGAVLLGPGDRDEGFAAFHFETFAKHSDLFESKMSWIGDGRSRLALRLRTNQAVRLRQDERYASWCAKCAAHALEGFLAQRALSLEELDLIVPSHSPAGFAEEFARAIDACAEQLSAVPPGGPNAHTAGPVLALESVFGSERYARARNVLLVAAGSGVQVSLALYAKNPVSG